jgi:hypothetical protein
MIFCTTDSVQKSGRISLRPICQSSTLLQVFCTLCDFVIADSVGVYDISDSVQEGRNGKNVSLPTWQSCSCVLSYTVGYCYCWQCGVYDISDSVQDWGMWRIYPPPPCLSITQLLEFFLTVWKSYCLCLVTSAILLSPPPPPPHSIIYIGRFEICIFLSL